MQPDEMKAAWRAQSAKTRLTIHADVLLNEIRRNHRQFDAMILCRDLREVGVSLVLIPIWIVLGIWLSPAWSWYLEIPALFWVAGFMLVDRQRQQKKRPPPGSPLRQHVVGAISDVKHQVWLLRNDLWWYLLPLGLPIFAFFSQTCWNLRAMGWGPALLVWLLAVGFLVSLYGFLYWLNQYAVRQQLEPRLAELKSLLASLDDTPSDNA